MSESSKYKEQLDYIHSETTEIKTFQGRIEMNFDQVQMLCLVRDGSYYIKEFIEYHEKLGVKSFIFLDNGSKDNTIELLSSFDNVRILSNHLPYKKYWHQFKRYLFEYYGQSTWNLMLDIDELFEIPLHSSLIKLIEYNNYFGYTACVAQMVDLVPNEELITKERKSDFVKTHLYYDCDGLKRKDYLTILPNKNKISNYNIKFHLGGWRNKEFNVGDIMLTKHPLIKGDDKLLYTHDHFVENALIADYTCILRHYKFRADFKSYVETSVNEENHFDNSREYKAYQKRISSGGLLNLYHTSMIDINHKEQLFKNNLFVISSAYGLFHSEYIDSNYGNWKTFIPYMLKNDKHNFSIYNTQIDSIKKENTNNINHIKSSWSWKIGYKFTRIFAPIFEILNKK